MRLLVLLCCLLPMVAGVEATAQSIKLQENFETSDSLHLPVGWTKWNAAPFEIDSLENWTVRDSGLGLPGLANATSKAHSGTKAVGVSWVTTGSGIADAWLITKRVRNIVAGDSLVFWATGGSTNYGDSVQIWIGVDDSLPASQLVRLGTLVWPAPSPYGVFSRYAFSLSDAEGFDVFVGFRYYGDFATVFGFFVHVDDVSIEGPTSVSLVDPDIPNTYGLSQNYPNPFNPTTTMEFQLPKSGYTTLKIYNAVGQEVATLAEGQYSPGTFRATWDANGFASGMYFSRLTTGQYTETRKLMLVK